MSGARAPSISSAAILLAPLVVVADRDAVGAQDRAFGGQLDDVGPGTGVALPGPAASVTTAGAGVRSVRTVHCGGAPKVPPSTMLRPGAGAGEAGRGSRQIVDGQGAGRDMAVPALPVRHQGEPVAAERHQRSFGIGHGLVVGAGVRRAIASPAAAEPQAAWKAAVSVGAAAAAADRRRGGRGDGGSDGRLRPVRPVCWQAARRAGRRSRTGGEAGADHRSIGLRRARDGRDPSDPRRRSTSPAVTERSGRTGSPAAFSTRAVQLLHR